jgi:hypothetical protein
MSGAWVLPEPRLLAADLPLVFRQFVAGLPRQQHARAKRIASRTTRAPDKPRKRCNKRRARIGMTLNFFRCGPLNRMFK